MRGEEGRRNGDISIQCAFQQLQQQSSACPTHTHTHPPSPDMGTDVVLPSFPLAMVVGSSL